jgi:ADP-heptose:LPS heptosyltransferase
LLKDIIQKSQTEAMETERNILLWGPTNPNKTGPRSLWNSFIKSELECSPCVSPFNANDEIIKCDKLIKDEC